MVKVAELVIGALYPIGSGHQAWFTLLNSREFYADMADRAWLPGTEAFVEKVPVSNSVVVTIMVVVFQAALAIAIFSQGSLVGPALVAGGVFSIVGGLTGSPSETVGYGVLAAIHLMLASAH